MARHGMAPKAMHSQGSSQPTGTGHGVISSLGATMWLQQTHSSGVIRSAGYQMSNR